MSDQQATSWAVWTADGRPLRGHAPEAVGAAPKRLSGTTHVIAECEWSPTPASGTAERAWVLAARPKGLWVLWDRGNGRRRSVPLAGRLWPSATSAQAAELLMRHYLLALKETTALSFGYDDLTSTDLLDVHLLSRQILG